MRRPDAALLSRVDNRPRPSADEPSWLCYEIDRDADAVLRSIDVFADGRITRDGVELEQRHGDGCPSLIDQSLDVGFAEAPLEGIARDAFEQLWGRGEDEPFWFPLPPAKRS